MNLKIYKYLNEYIQNKFPMYYEVADRAEFVKNIESNIQLKDKGKDKILSGSMDVVIDKLVHEYARLKLNDIWKKNLLQYVSEYIKKNFSNYYKFVNEEEFHSFVSNISLNAELTEHGLDAILAGNVNNIIDELVEEYTKTNMPEVEERIDSVKRYIIETIGLNSKFKDSPMLLEKIAMKITLENNNITNSSELSGSLNNSEIFNKYLIIRSNYKENLFNYIQRVILSSGKTIGFSDDAIEKIINDMVYLLLQNYGNKNMLKPAWLKKCFEKCCEVVEEKVRKHVKAVVEDVMNDNDLMIRVSARQVISDIVMMATVSGEINATKIVNGEMDDFIRSYINGKRIANDEQKRVDLSRALALEQVFKILVTEADEDIIQSELWKFAADVYQELKSQNFKDSDIIEYKCDQYIRNRYIQKYHLTKFDLNKQRMRDNSVSTKSNDKKNSSIFNIKLAIKRKIQQEIAKILIVSVLGAVGGYTAGNYINRREDMKSAAIVQEMDDTDYSINRFNDSSIKRSYERGVNGVVQTYNDYNHYGEDYGYLCFYNAYKELGMTELDYLVTDVRNFCVVNGENNGLIDLVQDVDCFYDYMYDCLVEFGCQEIKNDRYLDAILAYKQSYYGNRYGVPSDFLVHVDDQRALDDMCKLYEQYNFKYQVQLGNIIQQNLESVEVTGIKRGV